MGLFGTSRHSMLAGLAALLVFTDCAKPHSSSYYYAQKQIQHGETDFHTTLRVDEYLNAFTQFGIEMEADQSVKLQVDAFTSVQPIGVDKNFIQVGIRTRRATAAENRAPISLCMVLDVSGSMAADNKAKDAIVALKEMVMELSDGDELALILFANNAETHIGSTLISRETRISISDSIGKIGIGGGTDIEAGLKAGYREMTRFKNAGHKRLVLLTDGQSTVGTFSPQAIALSAGVEYNPGIRISTIGLGIGVEQDILRRIADEGGGYYYFSESAKTLTKLLTQELRTMLVPVAEKIRLDIELAPGVSVRACYGIPDSLKSRSEFRLDLGDMSADEWRIVVLEIEGDSAAWNPNPVQARLAYGVPGASSRGEQRVHASLRRSASPGDKPSINKYVARNGVLLANALSLVEIGILSETSRYTEALEIIDLQIGNMTAVLDYGDKAEMQRELDALKRVQAQLIDRSSKMRATANGGAWREAEPAAAEAAVAKSGKLTRVLMKGAELAIDALPGPWRTAAELLLILIE